MFSGSNTAKEQHTEKNKKREAFGGPLLSLQQLTTTKKSFFPYLKVVLRLLLLVFFSWSSLLISLLLCPFLVVIKKTKEERSLLSSLTNCQTVLRRFISRSSLLFSGVREHCRHIRIERRHQIIQHQATHQDNNNILFFVSLDLKQQRRQQIYPLSGHHSPHHTCL